MVFLYNSNKHLLPILDYQAFTHLEGSTGEAGDCPVFRFYQRGHVHVTASCRVDDVHDLWLPIRCDLQDHKYRRKLLTLIHTRS